MSQDDLFGAPAGWYPDPLGLPQLRWWNNHSWTEQTSAARQPMVVQDTKFAWADDEFPSRRDERQRERQEARGDRTPVKDTTVTADKLRELEPPRAFTKIEQQPPAGEFPGVPSTTAPSAPSTPGAQQPTTSAQTAPGEQKWWSAPKAAESRRAAAAAAAASRQAAPAPAEAAAPVADSSASSFFSAPTADPSASASSFASLFDTAPASAAPGEESLDALFGAETRTRRGSRVRTPVVSNETVEQTRPASLSGKAVSSTGSVWVIAMVPLIQLVIGLLVVTSLGSASSAPIFLAILTVPYLVVVALAYLDHQALIRGGNEHPAHWAWAFLSAPVYLLIRARATLRQSGHGIGPVLVFLGLGILQVVSVVAIPGLLIGAMPGFFAEQIEQSVAQSAAIIAGSDMTVSCPVAPPVVTGQEIVCDSLTTNGQSSPVTVTLARSNGWISWDVVDWGVYGQTGN